MNKFFLPLTLMLAVLWLPMTASARDIHGEIQKIHAEQQKLKQLRRSLEKKLGRLGRDMKALDKALLKARRAYRKSQAAWLASKKKVDALLKQKQQLESTIEDLQQRMQAEANMAWQRDAREPSWLDILTGADVTAIPHRQYMMRFLLAAQAKERKAWEAALQDLAVVEQSLQEEHQQLSKLKAKKAAAKRQAEQRWQEKHRAMLNIRHDVTKKKQRSRALLAQEKSLRELLGGLKEQLRQSDKQAKAGSIRHQKGRLPWPLRGKLVVHFGDEVPYLHRKSQGVQIAPASLSKQGLQVRAMYAGQVRYADWFGGFGLMMVVDYGHGMLAVYAHNDALHRQAGDWVDAGAVLADAGSTGWVEKTRLYFELRDRGKAVNPQRWCRSHK